MASSDEDRLFVKDGWKHYRRRYSLTEVRWGLATGATLALILAWVAWRAGHPADPNLFSDGTALLKSAPAASAPPVAAPTAPPSAGPAQAQAAAPAGRGPLPADLAGSGWREDKLSHFDPDNLYVKIDGRADYFRSFGFKEMWSVLLVSDKDPGTTIDVEVYDQAKAANALGAYGGERAPTVKPEVGDAGLSHVDRNALYLTRGRYYVRVIGSDESPAIVEKLRAVGQRLGTALPGEPLPWAYGYFVGVIGLDPGTVGYFAENAFSLSFANDVWAARPKGKNEDLEIFAIACADAGAAKTLAEKLRKGFGELGEPAGKLDGVAVIKDQFLGTMATAAATDRFVVGARGAANKEALAAELTRLRDGIKNAPAALKDRARPAGPQAKGADHE
jgi:hypothetical protein